uniref:class I SAM-dependent methyltransferase n=1 Tax=Algoriphagus sp. TaxID=1872435 RepID=UPI004047469A
MYTKISECRICGNQNLELVLDIGNQMLTGIFPKNKDEKITSGPLRLVKCVGSGDVCGLLQLEHSYDLGEMYGENYGYRSGLNASMVLHLQNKIIKILSMISISKGDLIVDIGSNDSTTLQAYPKENISLVGVDPTGLKFKEYYPEHINLIPDFFSSKLINQKYPGKKAKVVTSFSMFYDLEDPVKFMQEIFDILDDQGVWVFEQSYMPAMLEMNSYDTICHEHLEFYALQQIKWMADKVGFKIIDVELNDVNGGSFSIMVAKKDSEYVPSPKVLEILNDEITKKMDELETYKDFSLRIKKLRTELINFVNTAKSEGKRVAAIGASTKGNVLLQYCGFTENTISNIGEVNMDKFGSYTPGTWIPIISEDELIATKPDYLIVLPWHFRDFFLSNKKFENLNLVFPLPKLEVVYVAKK